MPLLECYSWHKTESTEDGSYGAGTSSYRYCVQYIFYRHCRFPSRIIQRSRGVVGINLRACASGPRAAESNEFQGWCGDELRVPNQMSPSVNPTCVGSFVRLYITGASALLDDDDSMYGVLSDSTAQPQQGRCFPISFFYAYDTYSSLYRAAYATRRQQSDAPSIWCHSMWDNTTQRALSQKRAAILAPSLFA
eukprot:scaffold46095_cov70-Attheya_sp.AAC.1